MKPTIAFFGTPTYSVLVLKKLLASGYPISVVITKPKRPIGREQIATPTPVAEFAQKNNLPLYTPQTNFEIPNQYANPDEVTTNVLAYKPQLLVAADYTRLIPEQLIAKTRYGGLNVHPSLLPSYKGPAPIPWALINDETKTGVTIVTLGTTFDEGRIIAQEEEMIQATDTTELLLEKLFTKGANLLIKTLPNYLKNPDSSITPKYPPSQYPRLTRDIGFENWLNIKKAIETGENAGQIYNKWRALYPWPGLWTKVEAKSVKGKGESKRLKILKLHLQPTTNNSQLVLDEVQIEGKQPQPWKEIASHY